MRRRRATAGMPAPESGQTARSGAARGRQGGRRRRLREAMRAGMLIWVRRSCAPVRCPQCGRQIVSLPCPLCGYGGTRKGAVEGTTGGGDP